MPKQQTWRGGSFSSIIMRSVAHIWLGQPFQYNRRVEEDHSPVSPRFMLPTSDWGNHAKTTDVARRKILQLLHDSCCSHLIRATMLKQQTWQIGVAAWRLLLTSDWGKFAKTTDVANKSFIWQQQSSRLKHKSISRRLSALITYYSNKNT
jgi:hypothetical protein